MSKKPLILTISIALGILLFVLISYYFLIVQNKSTTDNKPSIFKSFFPFGGSNNNNATSTTTGNDQTQIQISQNTFTNKLRKLSTEPVAGAGILDIKAGSIVRYMEQSTGHIFETELFSPKQGRISNTTIPVAYNAIWGNKNNSLISQYILDDNQTVKTYAMTVKQMATTTEGTVSAIEILGKINDVSTNGVSVFYLEQTDNGSSGYVVGFDGSKKKLVWSSPIKELSSQFVNSRTIALTTKPETGIDGYLYFVDTTTGQSKKILGGIPGLSTIVNDNESAVLYLSQGNSVGFYVLDTKAGGYSVLSPTTFPEKCVWSKKNKLVLYCAVPQSTITPRSLIGWYQGYSSFTDDIWKYDIKNNTASIIENLSDDSGESIDVIKPILSDSEQYLIFTNKNDNSLWSLDLSK